MTQDTESPLVLVVEDEMIVRIDAALAFESEGFRVLEAEDGQQALEFVDQGEQVDLLFTDVNMPGNLDGLGLAARICQKLPELRVIVTSGRPQPPIALPCEGRFVPKPYAPDEVCSLAQRMMEEAGRAS